MSLKKIKSKVKIDTGGFEFLNDSGQNITQRVRDGKTTLFKEREKAKNFARKKRSYVFDVRFYETTSGKKFERKGTRITKPYGFGVPN